MGNVSIKENQQIIFLVASFQPKQSYPDSKIHLNEKKQNNLCYDFKETFYTIKLFKDGFAEDACIPTTAFTNKKIELCFLQHPKYSSNINLKFPKPYMYIHVYA